MADESTFPLDHKDQHGTLCNVCLWHALSHMTQGYNDRCIHSLVTAVQASASVLIKNMGKLIYALLFT